jgi:folate-dependent phosphoribosylglycinamide formyltransferase PurN
MSGLGLIAAARSPISGHYLSALFNSGCSPTCVVVDRKGWSDKDLAIHAQRTAGRLSVSSVENMDGPFDLLTVNTHNSDAAIGQLTSRHCRVIVNAGTPRILSPEFLNSFDAVINCHPGILPRYRGCSCVEWAVFNDDPVGNTVHVMNAEIDQGPIVRTERVSLSSTDDYAATRVKVFVQGWRLLAETTRDVMSGAIDLTRLPAQPEGSYWKPIDPDRLAIVVQKLALGRYRFQS